MLKIDIRRGKILEQVRRDGAVSVAQLAQSLNATPVTIRSDLNALCKDGYLMRVQGGAVQKVPMQNTALPVKEIENGEEKQLIAKKVSAMVNDGDILFLNSGSTMQMIAAELKNHINLNIVTNCVAVAMELGKVPTFRVILLGGEINAQYGFTHGNAAHEQMAHYQADKAILSLDGISPHGGMTTYHSEESALNCMMIRQSKQVIIAADHTKIGRTGFFHFSDISEETRLVTTKKASENTIADLVERGADVQFAD